MTQTLLILLILLTIACLVLLLLLLRRTGGDATAGRLELLDRSLERSERALRDELARLRDEMGQHEREGRQEQGTALRAFGESLLKRMTDIAGFQKSQLDTFSEQLKTLTQLNE